MLNFGMGEIILVVAVSLIVVGPERLPEMLRFLGKQYGKLRAATYEFRREFTIEVDRVVAEERAELLKQRREEARKRLEAERRARAEQSGQDPSEPSIVEPAEYIPFDQLPSERESNSEKPDSQ